MLSPTPEFPGTRRASYIGDAPDFSATATVDVGGCARCGGDHDDLTFHPLAANIEEDGHVLATHWARCPSNGQPVLMRFKAAADA